MNRFAGRVAVVTGGGRGIGRATALLLAGEGAGVVVCARTASEIEAVAGGTASIHAIAGDVSDAAFVDDLFRETASRFGRVDVLVNNAAVLGRRPFMELEPALWDEVLAVNLRGAYLCARAAFRRMASQRPPGGTIVNLGSLSGVRGPEKFPGLAAYNVSKAGVIALSDILAVEGRPYGIRVNAVSPGAVDTAMLRQAGHGLRALATPEDVARAIAFLASDDSRPVTGANLEILSNA
ncbi:MAG TPA: SDR family oxidoreductase [Chloroflexota bacterium]|jgi:NAD(P)-dependent dehydrogenase (short-subunit alcohol dehydrogenase family)|nr:SDR family oxidoreductase [Chloroflexota bacterium]